MLYVGCNKGSKVSVHIHCSKQKLYFDKSKSNNFQYIYIFTQDNEVQNEKTHK